MWLFRGANWWGSKLAVNIALNVVENQFFKHWWQFRLEIFRLEAEGMIVTVLKQAGTLFLNNDMWVFFKIIIVSLILTHLKHMIRDVIRSRFTHFLLSAGFFPHHACTGSTHSSVTSFDSHYLPHVFSKYSTQMKADHTQCPAHFLHLEEERRILCKTSLRQKMKTKNLSN